MSSQCLVIGLTAYGKLRRGGIRDPSKGPQDLESNRIGDCDKPAHPLPVLRQCHDVAAVRG
jgi:hypothetical protein